MLPSITRKTDKGLPLYRDEAESDVYILSRAEDLVPVYLMDENGSPALDENGNPVYKEVTRGNYKVRFYRPRTEGLFARIERWTGTGGDVHWRPISKDNVLTVYGRDATSRIADPALPGHVFSWLICESYDDRGNAILYEYKAKNDEAIDPAQASVRAFPGEKGKQGAMRARPVYSGDDSPGCFPGCFIPIPSMDTCPELIKMYLVIIQFRVKEFTDGGTKQAPDTH